MTSNPQVKPAESQRCRLYLITPPKIDIAAFTPNFEAALDGGDVACVQLRLKDVSDDEWIATTKALLPLAQARNVAFLINDRPDIAAQTDADGCHIGQEDMAYKEARKLVGSEAIVGVTCHASRHLAMEAAEGGADYVAFGAFFPTRTKTPKSSANPEILEWWSSLFEVPCVAIGGITAENCAIPAQAGADFIAVSAGVWSHPHGPKQAVHDINAKLRGI